MVDCFNQSTQKWYRCTNMHDKRDELGLVVGFDGHVYAIGGFGGVGIEFNNTKRKHMP